MRGRQQWPLMACGSIITRFTMVQASGTLMRRWLLSILLISACLVAGVGIQSWLIRTAPQPARVHQDRPPLNVDGIVLRPVTKSEPLIGFGTVLAERTASVSAQVGGAVIERSPALRVGREVAAGQVLLQIDPRDYERQLERARSQIRQDEAGLAQLDQEKANLAQLQGIAANELAIAEREYTRVLDLFEVTQGSRREVDLARQALEAARRAMQTLDNSAALIPSRRAALEAALALHRADVALAELNLERCTLRAPFDGRIETVAVEAGEQVAPNQMLFTLLDPEDLEIPLELPVSQRDRVRVGTPCRVSTESRADLVWAGRVSRIAPSARADTRTFSAFVDIPRRDADQPLLPGMFVRAELEGPPLTDVLVVPRGSIIDGKVYTVSEGRARSWTVEVAQQLRNESIVRGVPEGATVIVTNLDVLYDGCPVDVRTLAPEPGTSRGPQSAGRDPAAAPQRGT